jgi:hypothetical protein
MQRMKIVSLAKSQKKPRISLVLSGLLGPQDTSEPLCELRTLLARSVRQDASPPGFEGLLFRLFGIDMPLGTDLPVAAVTRLADTGAADRAWRLRADPVSLQPQRDHLVLLDSATLDISRDEADALVAEINTLLAADGWKLEAPHPQRWYLCPGRPLALATVPPGTVIGRDIRGHLPVGEAARAWQARLSEIQMMLHMHPVNQRREADGLWTINSLWLWGGGELPARCSSRFTMVVADEPLVKGLAELCRMPWTPVPEQPGPWLAELAPGDYLAVPDAGPGFAELTDPQAQDARLRHVNREWCAPLLSALRARRLAGLTLYPGNARAYRVSSATLWKVWKRPAPLSALRDEHRQASPGMPVSPEQDSPEQASPE